MTQPGARALPDLDAAIALADARRRALRDDLAPATVRLPLRYWRQQAHFTTPAEEAIARKAVEGGTAPDGPHPGAVRGRPGELADRLGVDVALVERLLAEPRRAPLVMLDAEDALALTDEAAARGSRGRGRTCSPTADWSGGGPPQPALLPAARPQPRDDRRASCTACCGRSSNAPATDASRSTASCSPRSSTPRRWTWSTAC